jgi:FKBP-type peptidyl-prolyl cis-trans isomerase FkpA
MKNTSFTILIVAIVAFAGGYFVNSFVGGTKIQTESQVTLENDYDSLSYFFGLFLGFNNSQFLQEGMDANLVISGINTVFNDSSSFNPETLYPIAMELQQKIGAKEAEKQAVEQAANQEVSDEAANVAKLDGELYLEVNAEKEGVIVTESGLQYEVLTEGSGDHPTATATVEVHYHGTLINGSVFDSSVDRGEPVSFPLNRVIRGWTEGLQLMTIGSKYRFTIPSELAYGTQTQEKIPGNSVLIFDVELLSIENAPE